MWSGYLKTSRLFPWRCFSRLRCKNHQLKWRDKAQLSCCLTIIVTLLQKEAEGGRHVVSVTLGSRTKKWIWLPCLPPLLVVGDGWLPGFLSAGQPEIEAVLLISEGKCSWCSRRELGLWEPGIAKDALSGSLKFGFPERCGTFFKESVIS